MTERTMITAHSGCEGTEIDSLESVEKAIELGADVVEVDVRVGRWGTPRISHNELTILNNNQKIALADVLKKVVDTSLKVNFDIKEPEAVIKVFEVAKRFNMPPEPFFTCNTLFSAFFRVVWPFSSQNCKGTVSQHFSVF